MPLLELPHTPGCLVCGPHNPLGLHLCLFVDPETGIVHTTFTPAEHHIGFQGIPHGGVLATVLDEAMVWAATWHGRRFCVCGELTVRYRQSACVGVALKVEANVSNSRSRLIQVEGTITDHKGELVASASGKYVPMPADRHREFVGTLIPDPKTQAAARRLREESAL